MTTLMSTLKTSGRAAIVALTLGASVFTAVPAMAQPTPSFNFQFGIGSDGKPSVGFGVDGGGNGYYDDDFDRCMSNRQIIRGLRDEGYRDIEIVSELRRNRVGVVARYGRNYYSMRVNRCTGEVDRVQRLRGFRPGLSFEFKF